MNLVSLRRLVLAAPACLLTCPVAAHPGHGLTEHSALHLATSPFHVAPLLGLGAVLWLASRLTIDEAARWRFATLGTVSVGAAGVFWGLGA